MIEPQSQDALAEAPRGGAPADDAEMRELRSLLLGPAERQIAEIHDRLTDPRRQLEEVSRVLPAAVSARTRQDGELGEALGPTVTGAIERSVRRNPQPLVDAIFPVMGPAIRKAIAVALSGMVQSLNQTMAHSFSARGLRWRMEAWRTGKPFAEVVLLHTLLYRVEQVFLIHKETGLLLQHVVAGNASVQDADMVSGMLTAIQDFVHDSFQSPEGEQLETMEVGDLTVWVEQGPLALLAGVIRGTAPQDLRLVFQATLERIHLEFHDRLVNFSGDAAEFDAARPLLEDCLQSQVDQEKKPGSRRLPVPVIAAAGLVVIALLVWGFFALRARGRWDNYVQRLKSEPGIVVTETGSRGGRFFVAGLHDPLAPDPQRLLPEYGLAPEDVASRWEPYQSLSELFVFARAVKLTRPPATVDVKLDGGVLEFEGFATREWIEETRRAARFIPGVSQFRDENLLDVDRILKPSLPPDADETTLVPGQEEKFRQLVADIERLQSVTATIGKGVRLEITGHADGSGTEERNEELRRGRAEMIVGELKQRLPPRGNLTVVAAESRERLRDEVTEDDRAANRCVTFKIILTEAVSP